MQLENACRGAPKSRNGLNKPELISALISKFPNHEEEIIKIKNRTELQNRCLELLGEKRKVLQAEKTEGSTSQKPKSRQTERRKNQQVRRRKSQQLRIRNNK